MKRSERLKMRLVLYLLLTASGFAQNPMPRIAPDEAARQLVKHYTAQYPADAERARISGIVILKIQIDESGSVRNPELISGHPWLVSAAMKGVERWKYRPFIFQGKPTVVTTYVAVPMGRLGGGEETRAQREVALAHQFWTAADAAQEAISRDDHSAALEHLKQANEVMAPEGGTRGRMRWYWMTTMGQISEAKGEFEQAEKYHRQALEVYKDYGQEEPEVASSWGSLGEISLKSQKLDLAYDEFSRALKINQKNYKQASKYPELRKALGVEIAHQAAALASIATKRNDAANVRTKCQTVQEFQEFLTSADRESSTTVCGGR